MALFLRGISILFNREAKLRAIVFEDTKGDQVRYSWIDVLFVVFYC